MDSRKRFIVIGAAGCVAVVLILTAVVGALLLVPGWFWTVRPQEKPEQGDVTRAAAEVSREAVEVVPTFTPARLEQDAVSTPPGGGAPQIEDGSLASLYEKVNPGVVSIRVYVEQAGMTGQGAGSGFLFDDEGHIATNNHVVAQAEVVTVIFYDGTEARAEIVGTDADSDLAVIRVDELPSGVHALRLAESETVMPGDWVIAIGNPFSLGGSISLGIVSAVGRAIPSGATPFDIPRAIQTDAAINPGNSGGPLLSLEGQVVGVNAQIASAGTGANTGVGFAIPSDVVRLVVPTLIENGSYAWPWLGVSGGSVSLLVQEANDLETQRGAYIAEVVEGSPAAEAGLQGSRGEEQILGRPVPVGGDVVVEADGTAIEDFAGLLTHVAFKRPGDTVELAILRDGERQRLTVRLVARPPDLGD
ncbi:MAG: trypsin-like peptidase domain-containing protein [Anaerolineae bacterium]|jgi:2-alkenal reductase